MCCFRNILVYSAIVVFSSACGGGSNSGANNVVQPPVVVQEPLPSSPPIATGLDRLLGSVTLNYNFNLDDTVFTKTVLFDNSSFDDDLLIKRIRGSNSFLGCGEINAGGFEFLCAVTRPNADGNSVSASELFLFSLQTPSFGSGDYEFCSTALGERDDYAVCTAELVNSPDGVVRVSIDRNSSLIASVDLEEQAFGKQLSAEQMDDVKSSKDAEFGRIERKSGHHLVLTSDEVERLVTRIRKHSM